MKKTDSESLKIIACQLGARRRYAIPRMFEKAGVLSGFYTDSCSGSTWGKCATLLGEKAPGSMQRLARREIHGVPPEKVRSSDLGNLIPMLQGFAGNRKRSIELFVEQYRILSQKMIKWGLKDANTVYSMYHENLDFVRWAKSCGARSVVDVFIGPQTNEVMQKEYDSFPDWGGEKANTILELEADLWRQTAEVADVLICPSEWVAEGVRSMTPDAASKVKIVPYGCSIGFDGQVNEPEVGRILFAGGYALRKGLHYLARAATELKSAIPTLDVRIAGSLPDEVTQHPICKDLNFLGKLNSDEIKNEFLRADCFVLPSLSEGFAGVVAEALAAGCPVVVTKETGSPVKHEREGLIIPSRNTEALAAAIRRLVEDRAFRKQCSDQCLKQISYYSEEMWSQRLIAALV